MLSLLDPLNSSRSCSTGEALEIDLTDFINRLYALIPSLSLQPTIEDAPSSSSTSSSRSSDSSSTSTTSTLLFHALTLAFSPRTTPLQPTTRLAAFSKRLLTACLHWPPSTILHALSFVRTLIERDPKLEALLAATDDRARNGVYRPELDDPQVCNPFGTCFWEVHVLAGRHWSEEVRREAKRVLEAGKGDSR